MAKKFGLIIVSIFLLLGVLNRPQALANQASISVVEQQQATMQLVGLLKELNYFDFVESRIHGAPISNTKQAYWWAHWWTGVQVHKKNGEVTYIHGEHGSDNAGIQTSAYIENVCYIYQLTQDQKYLMMMRKLMRGMSAWILSSSRSANDSPTVLSRAFYPENVQSTDEGRNIFINYDASRPGVQGDASRYVHNPSNPFFGDIYLKNNRSIDDIGHMMRAIAQLQGCNDYFDGAAKSDLLQLTSLYQAWAQDVERNKFIIPTYDDQLQKVVRSGGIGDYNNYNYNFTDLSCVARLAVRLLYSSSSEGFSCGNGFTWTEKTFSKLIKNDAIEIGRSHHLAALGWAKLNHQAELDKQLSAGIVERINRDMDAVNHPDQYSKFDIQDIPSFLIESYNMGVPLTAEEIRFIYQRLNVAFQDDRATVNYNTFHLFSSDVPDGEYSYDPPQQGLYFYAIGSLIGSCTSPFRNKSSQQILDCDLLKAKMQSEIQ